MSETKLKYAVIATGGKQYLVQEGDTIFVEKLGVAEGDSVTFDNVLLKDSGSATEIGMPYLTGASVTGTIISEKKGRKVLGVRYKAKSNRRTKYGHRQIQARVKITLIK